MQPKVAEVVPKMDNKRTTWIWSLVVLTLLAVIVVGATLIGVYMTQKHTQAIIQMAFDGQDGEKVQQTVMVDNKEKVAAIYVKANNVSSTIIYDYSCDIIGLRRLYSAKCFVLSMKTVNVPSMEDVLWGIKRFQHQNNTVDTHLTYSIMEGDEADRTRLCMPVNILCSDVPIYWATPSTRAHLRWRLTIDFTFFGVGVSIKFES